MGEPQWLPTGVPVDLLSWPIVDQAPGEASAERPHSVVYIRVRGTLAYRLAHADDGRLLLITEYLDGHPTRCWERRPLHATRLFSWRRLHPLEDGRR